MRILMVSSYLPYPLTSGGHVRLYNILKGLSKNHEIILVCEKRDYQTQEDIEEIKKFCKEVFTFERKKQWSVGNILSSGFSSKPFLIVGHTIVGMKTKISHLINEYKPTIIHCETFYVMHNIPETSIPIILVEHNIEYMVYKRFIDKVPVALRYLLQIDVNKIKKAEESSWSRATKLVAVSEDEKKEMNKKDTVVIPNGVDTENFRIKISESKFQNQNKKLLFIGDFKWIQNRDAARWLLKELLPRLDPLQFTLWIVGREIPDSLKEKASSGVLLGENLPLTTSEIYSDSFALLAPIQIGGGTSYKILEAMASGVPVITTKLGNEGINAQTNREIIIAETSEQFLDAITELSKNKKRYKGLAENGRKFVEKNFAWETIVRDLEKVYISVEG